MNSFLHLKIAQTSRRPGAFRPLGGSWAAGFTMLELLTVMAIIAILTTVSLSAVQSLSSAGAVSKAISDFSGALQEARAYALANHTYVRVAIAQIPNLTAGQTTPTSIVLLLSSSNGTLSTASTSPSLSDMADATEWPAIERPLVLHNLLIYDSINGDAPDTSHDSYPSQSEAEVGTLSRPVPGFPTNPTFGAFIQFNPAGELSILQSTSSSSAPARYIKIAVDQPTSPSNPSLPRLVNPFILRMSGINGSITVLRKGEGI